MILMGILVFILGELSSDVLKVTAVLSVLGKLYGNEKNKGVAIEVYSFTEWSKNLIKNIESPRNYNLISTKLLCREVSIFH